MTRVIRYALFAAGMLALALPASAITVNFFRNSLDTGFPGTVYPNVRYPVDVKVVNMDGDIDLDLVVSITNPAGTGEGLYWYENGGTTIGFEVSPAGGVDVDVFSPAGVKVRTLLRESVDAGYHEVRWDGRDDAGRRVASGVYIARVRAHGVSRTHKMMLLM